MGKRKEITQEDRVLQFMRDTGSITSWQAIQEFGITRIHAKIFNLKKKGYEITKTTKCSKNRYGDPVHFAVYKLANSKDNKFKDGLFRLFGIKF